MRRAPRAQGMSSHQNVACPFCGLGCDDLEITVEQGRVSVAANGCPISNPAFASGEVNDTPKIDGASTSFDEAVSAAARVLTKARNPLFDGMGCDVAGMRAVLKLAERIGGAVEPANSERMLRNFLTLQDSGLLSTTLSEVRNRADLIVIAGADIAMRFPRFFERCLQPPDTLFEPTREIIYLGEGAVPPQAEVIACANDRLGEVAQALRALSAGVKLAASEIAGIEAAKLGELARRMKGARYGVLVWTAAGFDFPHAELTVQALAQLVKDLNRETRFSALPLGGGNGDITAAQVATWQTGYPLRIDFGGGYARYDPYSRPRDEADALVWISSFFSDLPAPQSRAPIIALHRAGMKFGNAPHISIPVGTPSIDHSGHVFRTDNVVAIRLKKLRESKLPSTAQAIAAIEKEL